LIPRWVKVMIVVTGPLAALEEKRGWFDRVALGSLWAYGAVCALLLLSVESIDYTGAPVPFVYFQF
jgi:hypothetical protein